MATTSEEFLNRTNAFVFLKEFTFDKNQFSPQPGATKEFADCVLWLERYLVVFQVKERDAAAPSDEQTIRDWFTTKVVKESSRQTRDTLSYLKENSSIALRNLREHTFNVNSGDFDEVIKVTVFDCPSPLPEDCLRQKFYVSTSTGKRVFIHILSIANYRLICEVLLTPIEVIEYFLFREKLLQSILDAREKPEKWILGRFLMSPSVPDFTLDSQDRDFSIAVNKLRERMDKFEVRRFLEQMHDRMIPYRSKGDTDYYRILINLALLSRIGLDALHQRLKLALKAAEENKQTIPYRFEMPKLGCGYVITSILRDDYSRRHTILANFVAVNMYERKLEQCVGISVAVKVTDKVFDIDWCFVEKKWEPNAELDKLLQETGLPFRPVQEKGLLAYDTSI